MRKLVWFALPFAAATCLFVYLLDVLPGLILAGVSLVLFLAAALLRFRLRRQLMIALAGLCAGFLFCAGYAGFFLAPVRDAAGQTATIRATVCDYPIETSYGCSVTGELRLNDRTARVLLYLGNECRGVQPGDQVIARTELRRSDLGRSGETLLYYQGKGISLIGYAREPATVEPVGQTPLRFWPIAFSERLRGILAGCLPPDCAGLMQALLTGDKSGISYPVRSDMTMAGLSHTIAISGMHVSMLLAVIALLTRKRRVLTAVIGIPIVVFFVFSTGCSPSVIRAAVMQTVFLVAPLLRRESDAPTALCAALLLILLQNPYAISNVSLQLSFGAMAGILLCTEPLYRRIAGGKHIAAWLRARYDFPLPDRLLRQKSAAEKRLWQRWYPRACRVLWALRRGLLRFLFLSITTTLGALVFTIPLTVLHFGTVSLYALLSNLLCLWAISICFAGGMLVALLGWIWLPIGAAFGAVLALPIRYVLWTAHWVAQLPFATLPTDGGYLVIGLLFCYALLGVGILAKKPLKTTAAILAVLVTTAVLIRMDARPEQFFVTVLDVGQGQSVAMLKADFAALYDCGGSDGDDAGQHAAEYFLRAGVRRLDALVLSHYDLDHTGGVPQLLYRLEVNTIYLPDVEEDDPNRLRIEALAAQYGIRLCYVREETDLEFSDGQLRIFPPMSQSSDNNVSLSLLFSCGDFDLLATGDMDTYGENLLLHGYLLPDVEAYVAGHHGSKYSTGTALLAALRPETVLVSSGYNRYGHPTDAALARCVVAGAEIYRTDQCGDLTIGR